MWWSTLGGIITFILSLLVAPLVTAAQPAGKVHRIGYLSIGSPQFAPNFEILRQRLRELGYVEGQNLVVEQRWAEGKEDRLPDLAAELVRLKVDVIVVGNPLSALAAQQATTVLPIVVVGVGNVVGLGLVASLARPGGNITGLSEQ